MRLQHQCCYCPKHFRKLNILIKHEINCLIRLVKKTCNICGEEFQSISEMKCHKSMYHPRLGYTGYTVKRGRRRTNIGYLMICKNRYKLINSQLERYLIPDLHNIVLKYLGK